MDCGRLRELLLAGGAPRGPEVDAHVAECAPCAELVKDGGELGRRLPVRAVGGAEPEVEAMLGELHGKLARDRGLAAELRRRPTPLRVFLALGAVAALALAVLVWQRRPDLGVYPAGTLLIAVASSVLLLGACFAIALRPLQRVEVPRRQRYALLVMALALPVILAARPHRAPGSVASAGWAGPEFVQRAAACFSYGLLLAFPVLVLGWALDRAEHRSLPNALLAAAAAGIGANLFLELHCPITEVFHLLAGHASVGLALVTGYALFLLLRGGTRARVRGADSDRTRAR